jgi:membrane associated rhomboid family serine protease
MIIPWRVDVPEERYPFANWLLVGALVVVFGLQMAVMVQQAEQRQENWEDLDVTHQEQQISEERDNKQVTQEELQEAFGQMAPFVLWGFNLKGLFGHMWLHAGLGHLLGNLLFMWIFGNAVCAKVGSRIYFPLYILFGLAAAFSHLAFVGGPVVGASGAINGVVGMFLVFFPENDITCYFTFTMFYWREFTVSSYWMILLWLAWDILGAVLTTGLGVSGGVAYFAHLGGFAVGFGIALLMLKQGWITMERYEKSLLEFFSRKKEPSSEFDPTFGLAAEASRIEKLAHITSEEKAEVLKMPRVREQPREEASQELIRFMCTCGKRVKVPADYAGKVGRCPRCGKGLRVPGLSLRSPDETNTDLPAGGKK